MKDLIPFLLIGGGVYFLLNKNSQSPQIVSAPPRSTGNISRSITSKGDSYVVWLQQSLNKLIGCGLAVDGIMGPITKACLARWQTTWGLSPTGSVDAETDYYLKSALGMPGYIENPYPGSTPFITNEF